MKKILALACLLSCLFTVAGAQKSRIHGSTFRRKLLTMTRPYTPQKWERKLFDTSLKTAFPGDLLQAPEQYAGRMIHLIGILNRMTIDTNAASQGSGDGTAGRGGQAVVSFELDNHYWDYLEDYSVQDEVMFVSPKGGGRFAVRMSGVSKMELEDLAYEIEAGVLLFVYGKPVEAENGVATLEATAIGIVNPFYYTTKVFSYDVVRNEAGAVVGGPQGLPRLSRPDVLRVAKPGQNK